MGEADVQRALEKLTRCLEEQGIPYAIVGALALGEHGYRRATVDVDVLVTREGLARFKERFLGHGYVERFAGSKGMRDTENGVPIDILLTGDHAAIARWREEQSHLRTVARRPDMLK